MKIEKVEYQSEILREAIRDSLHKQVSVSTMSIEEREDLVASVLAELAKIFTRSHIGDQLIAVAIKESAKS